MPTYDKKPQLRIVRDDEDPTPGIHHEAVYGALAQLVTFEMVEDPELMRAAIKDLYIELSLGDEVLVQELGALEEAGAIMHEDRMYLFVLFSVAGAHGMAKVTSLRDDIVNKRVDPELLVASVTGLSLPEPLKKYLTAGIDRIHAFNSRPKPQTPSE